MSQKADWIGDFLSPQDEPWCDGMVETNPIQQYYNDNNKIPNREEVEEARRPSQVEVLGGEDPLNGAAIGDELRVADAFQ